MRNYLFILILFKVLQLDAQSLFSVYPEIKGGLKNQCIFYQAHADSFGIMVLAVQPGYLNKDSSHIYDLPLLLRYDYAGNLLFQKELRLPKEILFHTANYPFIEKNDSTVLYFTDIGYPDSAGFQTNLILEINSRSCNLVQYKELKLTYSINHLITPRPGFITKEGNLILTAYATTYKRAKSQLQVIILDPNYSILANDTIFNKDYKLAPSFVDVTHKNEIEIIGTALNKSSTLSKRLPYKPFYIKLNDKLEIQKLIIRHDQEFVGQPLADDFATIREPDGTWIIEMEQETLDSNGKSFDIPYFYKFSPEFDSIIWKTNFYDGLYPDYDSSYIINSAIKCIDNSGCIAVGNKLRRPIDIPDIGIAFKVAPNGDSLWLRKYQIIGFEPSDPNFAYFYPITASPYNTYVVSGYYTDIEKQGYYPWLLQMDQNGCIVKDCNIHVNNTEISNGELIKPLTFFPNPVTQAKVFFHSQINSPNSLIQLINHEGLVIKEMELDIFSDTQYILDLSHLNLKGAFFLHVKGRKIDQTEKMIMN